MKTTRIELDPGQIIKCLNSTNLRFVSTTPNGRRIAGGYYVVAVPTACHWVYPQIIRIMVKSKGQPGKLNLNTLRALGKKLLNKEEKRLCYALLNRSPGCNVFTLYHHKDTPDTLGWKINRGKTYIYVSRTLAIVASSN